MEKHLQEAVRPEHSGYDGCCSFPCSYISAQDLYVCFCFLSNEMTWFKGALLLVCSCIGLL